MVAITVILAAVIAAFVLGLGNADDVAPSVSFDYDYSVEVVWVSDDGDDSSIIGGTSGPGV